MPIVSRVVAGHRHRIGRSLRIPGSGATRVVAVLVVLALGAGTGAAVALGAPALLAGLGLTPAAEPPPFRPRPAIEAMPADAAAPTAAGLAAALEPVLGAGGLGRLTGTVLDPASGDVLWAKDPSRAQVPGSTVKLLTAAAALLALEPTGRLATSVVAGPTPDSVVLVGGGDPTLSVLPAGRESVYPGAPKLDDLAAAVRAAHPGPIRQVIVDPGRYRGGSLAPGWLPADVPGGFVAPISALMVDGGRADPTAQDGARVADPARVAGAALAERLGSGLAVTEGTAPPAAAVLGEVASVPIARLVELALHSSDNVLAETLAREVALAAGAEPTFAGAAQAVLDALGRAGFDVAGAKLADGSGLSTLDQVPAGLLAGVLAKAAAVVRVAAEAGTDAPVERLRPMLTGLPVAGGDGTLDDRFVEGPASTGRGFVRAKTGTLTDVSSLAGMAVTQDGRLLVFALLSTGSAPAVARPQLDAFAATLRNCGCRAG